ncbi:hypothetical protein VPH35_054646 [Triticum aestivum]
MLFFVVNHGVPEHAMRGMEAVGEEFFRLPAPDVAPFYSDDRRKPNRFFFGSTFETGGDKYWVDCLRLTCTFLIHRAHKRHGNGSPAASLEVFGLRHNYFEGPLGSSETIIGLNHYPSCSNLDPRLGLGLPPHCDRNLITLLLPGDVPGLQISYKGDWITVEPMPNAFVVNFGLQLELIHHFSTEQVVTNGVLKSIEHRVMTNPVMPRTSVGVFIQPDADCLVGPAEEFVSEGNPGRYRTLTFGEFMRIHNVIKLGSSLNLTTDLSISQQTLDKNI